MYYVYKHIRPDTSECFYLGRGSRRRAWSFTGRPQYYQQYLDSLRAQGLEPVVEIVKDGLTLEESISLEAELSKHISTLINLLPGGVNSVKGLKWTEEQCKKQRRPKPEGFGAKMSAALKGRKMSEEQKEAIRKGMAKGNRLGKGGEKSSKYHKEAWKNPEYREHMLATLRTPERRAAQSARARAMWAERKRQKEALLSEQEQLSSSPRQSSPSKGE